VDALWVDALSFEKPVFRQDNFSGLRVPALSNSSEVNTADISIAMIIAIIAMIIG
jgi:hypothetical protein